MRTYGTKIKKLIRYDDHFKEIQIYLDTGRIWYVCQEKGYLVNLPWKYYFVPCVLFSCVGF